MKKILLSALVVIALTAQLTGCNGNTPVEQPSESSSSVSDVSEPQNSTSSSTDISSSGSTTSSSSSTTTSSSSSSSDSASEPEENSDTETTNEELKERAKAEYAKVKDKVTCDENTYVDRFVEYVEYGMDEAQAAFEVYLEFAKEQPNVGEVNVEKPSQSTQTPSQSTQTPSQSTQTPSQSTQTPSSSTQTPSQSTQSGEVNVKGEVSRNGHYVDMPGGRFWKDGGNYYYSKEDWLNGEEPVSRGEVEGVTLDDLGHINFEF